jgi:hypothetical protein
MLDCHDLEPGMYQVALPTEVQVVSETRVLREEDHFWRDTKWNPKTRTETVTLRTNTDGLLLQADALGVHVTTRTVEMDRQYCRVEATGYRLRTDGMLEVYRSAKEYDLAAELARATLKKIDRLARDNKEAPVPDGTTQALARIDTEQGALALVHTLPALAQTEILAARLEVQVHRLGLCETKASNRVLRYFVKRAGGVMRAAVGCKEIPITFQRGVLIRRIDPGQMAAVTASLYSPPAAPTVTSASAPSPTPTPAAATHEQRRPIEGEVVDEPDDEDERVTEDEQADEQPMRDDEAAADGNGLDDERDESEWGGEPASTQPLDSNRGPAPPPSAPDGLVTCHDCEEPVSEKSVAYCQSARGRQEFGGMSLCFRCQRTRRDAAKGGGA